MSSPAQRRVLVVYNADYEEEFKAKNGGQTESKIEPQERRDLVGNFIDSVRGKAKPHCNVDLGCTTMVAIKMAVESYKQSKTLLWDAQNEKVVTA